MDVVYYSKFLSKLVRAFKMDYFSHFSFTMVMVNVTRFGQILSLWQFSESLLFILQNINPLGQLFKVLSEFSL